MFARIAKNLPITRKLILIMVLTSAIAVLIASILFGVTEGISSRNSVAEHLATLGDVIGTNSTAAITFEDEGLASDVLQSLKANPEIEFAQMFMADRRVIATFSQSVSANHVVGIDRELTAAMLETVAETGEAQQRFFGLSHLEALYPINFDGELIGFLHMRTSLQDLAETLQRVYLLAAGTVLLAILVAIIVSIPLQSVISRPIVSLSNLMKQVTSEQDYSLRTDPSGNDEIGALMHGFNAMLEQISTRDEQLAEANVRLKRAVKGTLEARDAAVSASRAKSEFLARMSHEIRTPMNGVLGMTELLLTGELGKTERRFAETIQQSGETLLAVINDVLDFSKIEAGKLELDSSEFDLTEAVESIVGLLYSTAHAQGVELIADVCPDLHTRVCGDPVRLRQILMNLVGNAIKFTHEGEIILRLSAFTDEDGQAGFRFEVDDSGIGIDPEQQSSIFASFTQADVSTTREYGGTGLGLAISRQLVELMDGEIGVESTPGHGSTFWFTVMLSTVEPGDNNVADQTGRLTGLRALIVDDNPINREILERQLGAWDVDVVSAAGAAEAIEILQADSNAPFDVVLLDYFMPETDGLELAAAIRSRPDFGEPGLLMLSSAGPEFDPASVRQFGIDLYLAKPVRRHDLRAGVVKVLEGRDGAAPGTRTIVAMREEPAVKFGLRVLLVEDIPVNLQVAEHMLASIGCNTIAASNGHEALEIMHEQDVDLVLMDCQMPVMDGFTATRHQRARETGSDQRLPIVALTANALEEDRERCLAAGMDDFISKPFNRQTLIDAITRWAPDIDAEQPNESEPVTDQILTGSIDRHALDQIAELDPANGDVLVVKIIDTYLDDSAPLFEQLADAARRKDADDAARAAHALKSSSANVGASRLSGMCRAIELDARKGKIDGLDADVSQATAEYQSVVIELRATRREIAA